MEDWAMDELMKAFGSMHKKALLEDEAGEDSQSGGIVQPGRCEDCGRYVGNDMLLYNKGLWHKGICDGCASAYTEEECRIQREAL